MNTYICYELPGEKAIKRSLVNHPELNNACYQDCKVTTAVAKVAAAKFAYSLTVEAHLRMNVELMIKDMTRDMTRDMERDTTTLNLAYLDLSKAVETALKECAKTTEHWACSQLVNPWVNVPSFRALPVELPR